MLNRYLPAHDVGDALGGGHGGGVKIHITKIPTLEFSGGSSQKDFKQTLSLGWKRILVLVSLPVQPYKKFENFLAMLMTVYSSMMMTPWCPYTSYWLVFAYWVSLGVEDS